MRYVLLVAITLVVPGSALIAGPVGCDPAKRPSHQALPSVVGTSACPADPCVATPGTQRERLQCCATSHGSTMSDANAVCRAQALGMPTDASAGCVPFQQENWGVGVDLGESTRVWWFDRETSAFLGSTESENCRVSIAGPDPR